MAACVLIRLCRVICQQEKAEVLWCNMAARCVELSSEGGGASSGEQSDHLFDGARGLDGLRGAAAWCSPL